jgi:hypothetical protein
MKMTDQNETDNLVEQSRMDALLELMVQEDAVEFMGLLHAYIDMARGLDVDEGEIKDQIYFYVSGGGCFERATEDRVWHALSTLREELIEMRKQWRERFQEWDEERDFWDHLDLSLDARIKSAIIGEPEGEA